MAWAWQGGSSSQQGSHHGSDLALAEVAEYLASDAKLPSMGSLGSTSSEPHVFRPGWEDIFRMNQKQLEVLISPLSACVLLNLLSDCMLSFSQIAVNL